MRIVTWNCCRGPAAKKLPLVAALHSSISIIQECPRPPADGPENLWFGDNPRQGVAIIASQPYRLAFAEARDVPPFAVPIQVIGPNPFLLLAVWAKRSRDFRYVEAVLRAVDCYRDLIVAQPTVVAGDFNSNTIWDYKRSAGQNHSALVRKLGALGLVSAYHEFYGEPHGRESRPTLHMLRQRERPYHIDYCFVPVSWASRLTAVEVGSFESWVLFSDHVPLVVDVAFPDAA
jgi:hypothetical protein